MGLVNELTRCSSAHLFGGYMKKFILPSLIITMLHAFTPQNNMHTSKHTVIIAWDFHDVIAQPRKGRVQKRSINLLSGIMLLAHPSLLRKIHKFSKRGATGEEYAALLKKNKYTRLANTIEKIANDQNPLRVASNTTSHLYISNPFKGKESQSWFVKLFSTHPPIAERIARLRGN